MFDLILSVVMVSKVMGHSNSTTLIIYRLDISQKVILDVYKVAVHVGDPLVDLECRLGIVPMKGVPRPCQY